MMYVYTFFMHKAYKAFSFASYCY